MVKIYKRNLSFNGRLTPLNKSRVTQIVQHHMAHKSWHLDDVHNYHKNGNGWAGIGYNYWIDFKGNIYAGRGMNIGAHASGYNSTTIGVGYQGDFTAQTMPKAQLDAGIALNKWLMGQLPNKVSIVGHNDVGSTACPGKNFRMSELKSGVGSSTSKPTHVPSSSTSSNKSISQMASEIIAGKHGSGHSNRRKSLGISQSQYVKVRAEVNRRAGVSSTSKPKPSGKSISKMASEIIAGRHGSGHSNRRKSLGISKAQYKKVRAEVNRRASGKSKPSGKSISQMATEVIRGNHGAGHSKRRKSLGISRAQYKKVRAEVNKRL